MDWTSEHSRRRFMAFGIAGAIPFVAGGKRLLAQRPAIGSARPVRDGVVDQITSEMVRIHKSAKAHGLRAEHVHAFAGQVRVFAAHGRAIDLDARVRRGVGEAIDAHGRDSILDAADGDDRLDARLEALGVDPADRARRVPLGRDRRAALLDSLLVGGVSSYVDRLDAALARAEASAEKFGAEVITGPRTTPVQDCWQSWGLIIDEMTAISEISAWIGMPELAAIFGMSTILCEAFMWVSCWGG